MDVGAYWAHFQLSTKADHQVNEDRTRTQRDVKRWDLQQGRASDLPLRLSVKLQGSHHHPLLDAFFKEASRWSKVQISIAEKRLAKQLNLIQRTYAFSNLTNLRFSLNPGIWDRDASWPFTTKYRMFVEAPKLKTLAITGKVAKRFDFPWRVVEHLTLTDVDSPKPECDGGGWSSAGLELRWSQPIVMSKLRE